MGNDDGSRVPILGTLPPSWRLLEFASVLRGGTRNGIYKSKEFHGIGDKIVNMGELFAYPRLFDVPMKRIQLTESERERFSLCAGDLLFARRSLVAEGAGKCSIVCEVPESTTFESSLIRARPNTDIVDSMYLYYVFQSPYGQYMLDTIRRHVAVAGITGKDLEKLLVPFPPLAEQHAIARILGALDDKIELNRRMNDTLEATARALFHSWFVAFDPVHAKAQGIQPPGLDPATVALFPATFDDSPLGPIPHGWNVCAFSETVTFTGGGTPKTSTPEYWGGEIPWFSVVDAPRDSDIFVIDTEKKITQAGLDNSSTRILQAGTTIISARGTVGRCALVGAPMAMNQSCYGVKASDGRGDYFTYFSLRRAVADLQRSSHGSVFDTITRDTFERVTIVCPPVELTARYDNTIHALMEKVRHNLHESRTLAATRDVLLPKLLSGEVRVPEAEQIMEEVTSSIAKSS